MSALFVAWMSLRELTEVLTALLFYDFVLSFMCLKSVDGPRDSCSSQKKMFSLYSLALIRMSVRDFPLRYDRRGDSLKIFLSCGWFCIKCNFPMTISFKLDGVV